ncbi:uncharacterized protein LOC118205159 [Stegodyphus dumicola]|uniref:uncharacterized protein LOC118205159 n=1 Tax=Stegodyphus dumicola TaxID=202533 RepID=UPI0015B24917|nr:uncharacterized protein LOC118205159 [Stegodyphus dumicola]XP_035233339.1 uncharacterized protein LOC118205159 [Stegodyphus dumicola]XP_035233340.1 uncharacterized protein LOC118205159 [Stegodyphus dumicola]XP_035233341.1 uncharacterized protein LOC118205159 [Stegodyphus dumicola]XP_035233342.1 uncharacterized protein LOC118205159 [Stegodyphus dumicola]
MGLIQYYLRVFFRSHFKPMDVGYAKQGVKISKVIYFMSAWSLFICTLYLYLKKSDEIKDSPYAQGRLITARDLARRHGSSSKDSVIYYIGMTGVQKEVVSLEDVENEDNCKACK